MPDRTQVVRIIHSTDLHCLSALAGQLAIIPCHACSSWQPSQNGVLATVCAAQCAESLPCLVPCLVCLLQLVSETEPISSVTDFTAYDAIFL